MKPTGPVARYYQWLLGVKRFPVRHGPLNLACGLGMCFGLFGLFSWAEVRFTKGLELSLVARYCY